MIDKNILQDIGVTRVKPIRANHRWSTYSGIFEGREVFVKICQDLKNLASNIKTELNAFSVISREYFTDPPFSIPAIVTYGESYIVYELVKGEPMSESGWYNRQGLDMIYSIYQWFYDNNLNLSRQFSTKQTRVDVKSMSSALRKMESAIKVKRKSISKYFGEEYLRYLDYALNWLHTIDLDSIMTIVAHGDLTPANIITPPCGGKPFVIDWESFGLKPPNYEAVNFTYNYALKDFANSRMLLDRLAEFCDRNNIRGESLNVAFYVRFVSSVVEGWGDRTADAADKGGADYSPEWLGLSSAMIEATIAGRPFYDIRPLY